jgi:LIVCS family branched-chain amino acid:cation transporter
MMTTTEYSLTTEQPRRSSLLTTGFALFSMFFGAGNLIFPLIIGKSVGSSTWYALLGLSITAVAVPFLGLAAMMLFQADYKKFFGRLGKYPGILLLLLLQLILGPCGVIPRLITLMYAMSKPYLFGLPLSGFSILAVALIFACTFKRDYLIKLIGAILTPVLLIALAALMYLGLTDPSAFSTAHAPAASSFVQGLVGGYNTMDLIAAFLFATVMLPHFQKSHTANSDKKGMMKEMFWSSLIAAALLMINYIGLAWVSSLHSWTVDASIPPEELLGAIACKLLGPAGGFIAAITVILACLTTAITLASIFADYLQVEICKKKIKPNVALIVTLVACMLFANLGFSGIVALLAPILQVVYPGLIVLTVFNFLHSMYGFNMVKTPVFAAFAIALICWIVPA